MLKSLRFPMSLVALVVLALALFAGSATPVQAADPAPMLVLSDISCDNGNIVAHFVLNKIPAGAKVTGFTVGGDLAGAKITDPRFVGKQQVAHFYVTIAGTGATTYDVQASVMVNGQKISLHNAGDWEVAPCGSRTGTLKICKVLAAGTTAPAGTLFTFTVSGMADVVSVAPGTCSANFELAAGDYTVAETGSRPAGYMVTAIDFLAGSGTPNVAGGSTVATVVSGQTTEVRFTNQANRGTLKICKALAAGTTAPAGTLFGFTVSGMADVVSVAPGTCSANFELAAGDYTVTETGQGHPYTVTAIDFLAGTGTKNVAGGSTVATVVSGQTTEVRFTNQANRGTLKICKALAEGTTAPAGTLFTFTAAGAAVSVAPGTCSANFTLAAGDYTVAETGPAGYTVTAIDFLAGSGTPNVAGGSTVATVVSGQTTEVRFTNQQKRGFIQLCKETGGGLTGTFSFTSPAFAGPQNITVFADATQPVCAPLTEVVAGEVAVTEAAGANFTLDSVRVATNGSLVGVSGMTATVNVPAGTPAQQTQLVFRNVPSQGTLKICKALAEGTTAPAGTVFTFAVSGQASATDVAPGACKEIANLPAGPVTITENEMSGWRLVGIEPSSGSDLPNRRVTVTIVAGQTTEVRFTNQQLQPAYIQICKVTTNHAGGAFSFTSPAYNETINVDKGATQPVCGTLTQVISGQRQVTEAAMTGWTLQGVTVQNTGSLVGVSGNTATVDVPAGGPGQQTIIVFTNKPS